MSFLTLNGIAVPIAVGDAELEYEAIGGEFSRAPGGAGRDPRFAAKRNWRLTTVPQIATTALPQSLLAAGRGHLWSFNADVYDGKGNYARGTPVFALHTSELAPSIAAATLVANPKFGAGCVGVWDARTNIFTEDIRTGTDTSSGITSFNAIDGATLSSDATQFWQGVRSLKAILDGLDGVRDGFSTDTVTAAAATAYYGSVYLKAASGTPAVRVYLKDDLGLAGTAVSLTLSSTVWTRAVCTLTTSGGAAAIALYVENDTATAGMTFYADGFQCEAGAFATSWIPGTGATIARAAGSLAYQIAALDYVTDLTVMFWTRGSPGVLGGNDQVFVALYDQSGLVDAGPFLAVACLANASPFGSAGDLVVLSTPAGVTFSSVAKASPWNGAWHHVAAVWRRTGGNRIELFFDGASQGSATPASMPAFTTTELGVGSTNSGAPDVQANALLDDLVVLPFAAPASWISTWYAQGQYPAAPPRVVAAGDAIGPASLTCFGAVEDARFAPFHSAGAWQNNASAFTLRLREA